MALSDEERKVRFVKYLNREFEKFADQVGARVASLESFSRYVGVNSGAMGHYMRGNRTPNYRNMIRMAKILGPEIYEVLDIKPDREYDDPKESYLIHWWRNASPKQREGLLKTAAKLRGPEVNN